MPVYRYRLYGLNLASEIELPELAPAKGDRTDVSIVLAPRAFSCGDDVMDIEGVASYRVPDRHRIEVHVCTGSLWAQLRLFLLGSAMAMILYRRGVFALHANAVVVEGGTWAFAGESGAGKSTLALWMSNRDYPLLADDVCAIDDRDGGNLMVFGGVPRLRLWEDAVLREGLAPGELPRSFPGDDDYRKYDVSIDDQRRLEAAPLRLMCILERAEHSRVERLEGLAAVEALYAHSYRGHHVTTLGKPEKHWQMCLRIAREVPVFRYCRTMQVERMDEENEAAVAWLTRQVSGGAE